MSKKSKFTSEQIEKLRASPLVLKATETTVSFTSEFKQILFDRLHSSGLTPEDILLENGIDPAILGSTRIRGLVQRVEGQAVRYSGFSDLRFKDNKELRAAEQAQPKVEPLSEEARLKKLEQDVINLDQKVADMTTKFSALAERMNVVLTRYNINAHLLESYKKKRASERTVD